MFMLRASSTSSTALMLWFWTSWTESDTDFWLFERDLLPDAKVIIKVIATSLLSLMSLMLTLLLLFFCDR